MKFIFDLVHWLVSHPQIKNNPFLHFLAPFRILFDKWSFTLLNWFISVTTSLCILREEFGTLLNIFVQKSPTNLGEFKAASVGDGKKILMGWSLYSQSMRISFYSFETLLYLKKPTFLQNDVEHLVTTLCFCYDKGSYIHIHILYKYYVYRYVIRAMTEIGSVRLHPILIYLSGPKETRSVCLW